MKNLISRLWKKIFTREIITYLIAGVLTTAVNFAVSYLFYDILKVNENITTAIAWVVAVSFAYVVNNVWVFRQGNEGGKREAVKAGKFFTARLLTLAIEWGGMFWLVTCMEVSFWLVKIPLAVIVTILNYVFSKLFIFIRKSSADTKCP